MQCQVCQEIIHLKYRFTDIIFLRKEEAPVCQSCTQRFEPIGPEHCPQCYKNQESKTCLDCITWSIKDHLVSHQSLYCYNQAMKDYFSQFKFQGDYLLGTQFKKELKKALLPYKAYTIVPIPISEERRQTRRFNQVEALLTAAQVSYQSLLEKKDTLAQSSKSKKERLQVRQCFTLKEGINIPQKVLIVDDIYTTGQTIYLAKKLLQQHGVSEVKSFSLAR